MRVLRAIPYMLCTRRNQCISRKTEHAVRPSKMQGFFYPFYNMFLLKSSAWIIMIILDVLFSVNTGNIGLALQKYWTRLRLVQYFCKARPLFPCINLKAIQYYIIIIYTSGFNSALKRHILSLSLLNAIITILNSRPISP